MLPDGMQWKEYNIGSLIFLPKMHRLILIMKTHQRNLNGGTILQNDYPLISTNVKVIKVRTDWQIFPIKGE